MMRKRFILALCIGCVCLLSSCDMVSSLTSLIPKFSTETPNMMVGTYKAFTDSTKAYYTGQIVLASDGNYSYKDCVANTTVTGTYTYTYDHLDILQASGTMEFSAGFAGTKQTKTFSYTADVDAGPKQLILDGTAFQFIKR